MTKRFNIKDIAISNDLPFILIAGPCQIESESMAVDTAGFLSQMCKRLGLSFVFKTSFDKANRSSIKGARGIGLEKALDVFKQIRNDIGCPILTDVHKEEQCELLAPVVDVLQIPAFLCRQTDLLIAAGKTGKVVNVKKGQFLAPEDMENVIDKIKSTNNDHIILTERGTFFGYGRLVVDYTSLSVMSKTGYPIVFDATHSVQFPGGQGTASGGAREYVPSLARAAVAVGIAGLFVETHPDPDKALSDGPCMIPLNKIESMLAKLIEIDNLIKNSKE